MQMGSEYAKRRVENFHLKARGHSMKWRVEKKPVTSKLFSGVDCEFKSKFSAQTQLFGSLKEMACGDVGVERGRSTILLIANQ